MSNEQYKPKEENKEARSDYATQEECEELYSSLEEELKDSKILGWNGRADVPRRQLTN